MTPWERAKECVDILVDLGYSQERIASEVGVCSSHISRIRNDPDRSVSEKVATLLAEQVERGRMECFEKLIQHLSIKVLDACPNEGVIMDENVISAIHCAILDTLKNLLTPNPSPIHLPAGFAAAIASLGQGLYIIKLSPDKNSIVDKLNLIAHEMKDLAGKLHAQQSKAPHYPKSEF